MRDTIYAHSSGGLPSGVAIVRISGPKSRIVVETMCSQISFGAPVGFGRIVDSENGNIVDRGLILTFVAPRSFTGEDLVEFQVHGGRAIVDGLMASLGKIEGLRHAEAGEFTYRAFENGKLDLTQVEGLADLIASETEAQRRLAFDALDGKARAMAEGWSQGLLKLRAWIEAEIDFVDEDDIPGSVSDRVWQSAIAMIGEMEAHLSDKNAGEIIRNGFRVALLGRPNAGKSTLLNVLAGRDVAIVTDIAGTTRDVLEVKLNLGGQVVIINDTAGIHDSRDKVEKEGIKRARKAAQAAQMRIWLHAADDTNFTKDADSNTDLVILSKADKISFLGERRTDKSFDMTISAKTGFGLDQLVEEISKAAKNSIDLGESAMFSRERQKTHLAAARNCLRQAVNGVSEPLEIRAENMRMAGEALGKLVGRIDVEDMLGEIFSEFCVGK